jgi:putative SOS response-associated peptidase YedK
VFFHKVSIVNASSLVKKSLRIVFIDKLTYIFSIMCGRFSIFTPIEELRQRFNADPPDEAVVPRYNAAPGQSLIVIPMADPKKMHLYKWGLIPHWAKDEKIGYKMINARAESLKEKPAFRGSLQKGRCLVIADGFYEWSVEGAKKVPYRIELSNRKPFAMAGLLSHWKNENGKEINSFTIITTEANKIIGTIHDRMPVILDKAWERKWLDPLIGPKEADQYLVPYLGTDMEIYPISTLVNSPKNDTAAIIKPMLSS